MHLTHTLIPGVIILRGNRGETIDAFSTEEVETKFCKPTADTLEREGWYQISKCIEKCKQKCSYVIGLLNDKGY